MKNFYTIGIVLGVFATIINVIERDVVFTVITTGITLFFLAQLFSDN